VPFRQGDGAYDIEMLDFRCSVKDVNLDNIRHVFSKLLRNCRKICQVDTLQICGLQISHKLLSLDVVVKNTC